MRRPLAVLLLLTAACSSPSIRLEPRFQTGASRAYRLQADSTTTLDVGGSARSETINLVAQVEIEVLSLKQDEASLRVRIEPTAYRIDGKAATAPESQEVEVVVAPDGTLRRIARVGGVAPEAAGGDVQELAPLLGSAFPTGAVRVGERWTRTLPRVETGPGGPGLLPGTQRGRLAALRKVGGRDCAIVALATERPVVRSRQVEGRSLALQGTEYAATEIAFAFREGYQVRIETNSDARLSAASEGLAGGTVTIAGRTVLTLRS